MSRERRLLGQAGEALAADALRQRGYTILQRNFRTPCGEIDLVAQHDGAIVFIEVKMRRTALYGSPAEAVHGMKKRRIVQSAQYYLQQQGSPEVRVRFDVVAITMLADNPEVEIFRDAFEAD